MKLGLINSAWAQAGRDTAFGIRQTREIGFDTIDIFADPLDLSPRERKLIREECQQAGLPIVSIACVAVGLIDFNPSVQRFHLDAAAVISIWPTNTRPATSCWYSASTYGRSR